MNTAEITNRLNKYRNINQYYYNIIYYYYYYYRKL